MGVVHRAGMKCRDLIVVHVRGDISLGGVTIGQFGNVPTRYFVLIHPPGVRFEVHANGTHRQRIAAEHFEIVSDVARAAAKLPAHPGRNETHIENMHLFGQDVIFELIFEHHDGVIGERTAN